MKKERLRIRISCPETGSVLTDFELTDRQRRRVISEAKRLGLSLEDYAQWITTRVARRVMEKVPQ
jgi:hypothetical protein